MTTEEKLQHFMDATIKSATQQSEDLLVDYKSQLNQIYEDHKKDALGKSALKVRTETDGLERNMHKELSKQQIEIKRALTLKHIELKDKVFHEVEHLVEQYMATPEYHQLIVDQIKEAKKVAAGQELIVYIDKADASEQATLSAMSGVDISISETSFMGGMKAVIPSKNILIDNSFETKINTEREHFNIPL